MTHNPSLALANTLGSSVANILGSFSVGLVFANFTARPGSPASSLFAGGRGETYSAKIYTTALVVITFFVTFVGPFNEFVQATDHRRRHGHPHRGTTDDPSDTNDDQDGPRPPFIGAGRWVGIVLVLSFFLYLACITYGIYQGVLVAPQVSDESDTSDRDGADTTDTEEEDAEEDDTTFEYRVEAGQRELRRARNAERARLWTGTSIVSWLHFSNNPPTATENAPLLPPQRRLARRKSTFQIIYRLIMSTLLLSLSGYLLSSTAASLAEQCHLSNSTVGVTLLSIGTTLPEKLVAYKSGRKGERGVLIANTVGSNIFLQTLVLGVIWCVRGHVAFGIGQKNGLWIDVAVVLGSSIVLWCVVWFGLYRRWIGVALFVAYLGYLGAAVGMGRVDVD